MRRLYTNAIFLVLTVLLFVRFTDQTAAQTSPLAPQNIQVSELASSSASISWTTLQSGDSWVGYSPASGGAQQQKQSSISTTQHKVNLSGLLPDTKYIYEVNSSNAFGDTGYATGLEFKTLPSSVSNIGGNTILTTGSLASDAGTVYFIMFRDKIKIPFTTPEAFLGLGYAWKNVQVTSLASYKRAEGYYLSSPTQEHPWGSWLVWRDGTVYYHHFSGMIPVPSWQIFLDNGGRQELIVPMNRADEQVWEKAPNLPVLVSSDERIL